MRSVDFESSAPTVPAWLYFADSAYFDLRENTHRKAETKNTEPTNRFANGFQAMES
ncbi:MAG: hypothetical protein Kow0065_03310 [Methylomicrobium sp.]